MLTTLRALFPLVAFSLGGCWGTTEAPVALNNGQPLPRKVAAQVPMSVECAKYMNQFKACAAKSDRPVSDETVAQMKSAFMQASTAKTMEAACKSGNAAMALQVSEGAC